MRYLCQILDFTKQLQDFVMVLSGKYVVYEEFRGDLVYFLR